jgi:hypothetical protein
MKESIPSFVCAARKLSSQTINANESSFVTVARNFANDLKSLFTLDFSGLASIFAIA